MSNRVVAERVRALLRELLVSDPPTDETDLIESGLLDSLALVELIAALEQEFGFSVQLDTLEIETFRSIDSIAGYVEASPAGAA